MDERFRDKRLWIGLAGIAVVILCIAMCGLSTMAFFTLRQVPMPYAQPPVTDGGAVPPPAYYGYGGPVLGGHAGISPFSFIVNLFLAGLLALLFLGLLKRVLWGRRYHGPHHWHRAHHAHPPGGWPPSAKEWKCGPWGWAWADRGEAEGADGDRSGESSEPSDAEAPYAGPQE